MAWQMVARLGLNTKGFMSNLATSQGAWQKFTRFVAGNVGAGFLSSGGAALWDKIFPKREDIAKRVASVAPAHAMLPVRHATNTALKPFSMALGAAGAAFTYFSKKGIDAVSEIKDLAEQSDLSTDVVQRLSKAAVASGLEFGKFDSALTKGEASRRAAAEGNAELRESFRRYGIGLRELQNPSMTMLDLMLKMSAAAKGMSGTLVRTDFRELFGKGAEKLVTPLANFDANAPVVSDRAVENVDRLGKGFARLGQAIKTAAGNLTGNVLERVFGLFEGTKLGGAADTIGKGFSKTLGLISTGFGLFPGASAENPIARATGVMHGPFQDDPKVLFQRRKEEEEARLDREEKLQETKERIREEELRGMTPEQRRLGLQKDLLNARGKEDFYKGLMEAGLLMDEQPIKDAQLKRQGLESDLKILNRSLFQEPVRDSLAAIGGGTGSEGNAVRVQEEIKRELETQSQTLLEIKHNTRDPMF